MADGTKIEWTDATVNAINGCTVLSPGCTNCYAMRLAGTRLRNHESRSGLTIDTKAGPVWNGEVRLYKRAMVQPLGWRKPRMIFWNAHGDTFHPKVPEWWIDHQFAIMAATPQHIHQILTKRPERMRQYLSDPAVWDRVSAVVNAWPEDEIGNGNEFTADIRLLSGEPLPNVWLGTSVEDQKRADERIPDLLATPAAVRWLSMEPLLGPVDLSAINHLDRSGWLCPLTGRHQLQPVHASHEGAKLDWIVLGGESGPGARPMHPDWARSVRDQCAAAGVPFHFKQWGEWAPLDALRLAGEGWATEGPVKGRRGNVRDWMSRYVTFQNDAGALRLRGHTFTGHGTNLVYQVGKKAAGRLLDGVEHNGFPERIAA